MSFTDAQQFKIPRPIVNPDFVNVETITVTKTLTMQSSTYQALENNTLSPLTCILPSNVDGAQFWIMSTGSQGINVNTAGGSTVASLNAGQTGLVISSSSQWINVFKV